MLTSLIWSVERSTDLTGLKDEERLSSICMAEAEAAAALDCACLLACSRELRRFRELRSRSPRLGVNGSLVHECVEGEGVMVGAGDESTRLHEWVGDVQPQCWGAMCDARRPRTITSSASDSSSGSNGMGGGDEQGVATAEDSWPDAEPLAETDEAAEQLEADKHDDDIAPKSSVELFRCDECECDIERSNDGRACSAPPPAEGAGMQFGSSYACGGGDGSTDRLLLPCCGCPCVCCAACCCTLCNSSSRSASCFASSRPPRGGLVDSPTHDERVGQAGDEGHCMQSTGWNDESLGRVSIVGRMKSMRDGGATAHRAERQLTAQS